MADFWEECFLELAEEVCAVLGFLSVTHLITFNLEILGPSDFFEQIGKNCFYLQF